MLLCLHSWFLQKDSSLRHTLKGDVIAWSTSVLCRNGTYGRIKVSIRKADILARGRVMNGAVIRVDGAASVGSTNVPSDLVISPVTGSGVSAVVSDWLLSVVPESSELAELSELVSEESPEF